MRERIVHLEEQSHKEKEAIIQETERLCSANRDYHRGENVLLNRRQKKKDSSESDVVKLLKEQVFCSSLVSSRMRLIHFLRKCFRLASIYRLGIFVVLCVIWNGKELK